MLNYTNDQDLLYFNGINAGTGAYGLPPMAGEALAGFIKGEARPENLEELKARQARQRMIQLGPKEGVDPKKLAEAGWGVIFAREADPAIKEALQPLLDRRREEAGDRFRLYEGAEGYLPGESKSEFLARHGAGPGPADPAKVPYYLLLVGSPEAIPYEFQYQLDVQYAVGRLHFETVEGYANYARSLLQVEQGQVRLPRRVGFFGVANPDDKATELAVSQLVEPLSQGLYDAKPDWEIDTYLREDATKRQLARLLGGDQTPALLFTASHGVEFDPGHPRQLAHQGALLCQDWPGPGAWQPGRELPQDFYFAGEDLSDQARLLGLITFHFACFGAGTPLEDDFYERAFGQPKAIAAQPFVARLPQKLLGHPSGGALAVVGHVERAWGYSFMWPGAGAQTAVFQSALERLLGGHPVGSAFEYFNERYAELATVLSDTLRKAKHHKKVNPYELAGLWTANNDARSYVILGDPAVRLPVADPQELPLEQPMLEVQPLTPSATPKGVLPPTSPEGSSPPSPRGIPKDVPSQPISSSQESPAKPPLPETAGEMAFSVSPPAGDEVHFSAYHPRAVLPGEWHKLLIYAHLAAAAEAIKSDMGQRLGQAAKGYGQRQGKASLAIPPGTIITLIPQATGLEFEPAQAQLSWSDPWQRVEFQMRATGERAGHVVEGSIGCYVGPLLIASIRLPVVVKRAAEQVEAELEGQEVQSARMYQAIFASYAHADLAIVEAMEVACKALGMDYLRDVMTLKAGQRWSDELLNMIERADIFQLFWSPTSSQSPYVEQEWQYALTLAEKKGPAFIRPIYWEKPLAPVPPPLSHLHFAPVESGNFIQPGPHFDPAPPQPEVPAPPVLPPAPILQPGRAALLPAPGEDIQTLTVSTYTTADPGQPETARLKIRTRLSLTGDVELYLPEVLTPEDERYLELHQKLVKEALKARLAYLKLIMEKKPPN
jgi:hypothetical protein